MLPCAMLGVLLAASCTAAMVGVGAAAFAAGAPAAISSAKAKGASLLNKDPWAMAGQTHNPRT
jgi:hypothetical protein